MTIPEIGSVVPRLPPRGASAVAAGFRAPEAFLAGFLLLLTLVVAGSIGRERYRSERADGYVAKVNYLISKRAIVREPLNPDAEGEAGAQPGGMESGPCGQGAYVLNVRWAALGDEQQQAVWRDFYQSSYLPEDLKDLCLWEVSYRQVVRYNESARVRFVGPAETTRRIGLAIRSWDSNLEHLELVHLRTRTAVKLFANDMGNGAGPIGIQPLAEAVLGRSRETRAFTLALKADQYGPDLARLSFFPGSQQESGSLQLVFSTAASQVEWSVNGEKTVPQSSRAVSLLPGDELQVTDRRAGKTSVFLVREPDDLVIGEGDLHEGRPVVTGLDALDAAVAAGLPAAIANSGEPPYSLSTPQSTLLYEMQLEADAVSEWAFSDLPPATQAASVVTAVVMNGSTGALMALGSRVPEKNPNAFRSLKPDLPPVFRRLQIGSAAKPLFAHAILAAHESSGAIKPKNLVVKNACPEGPLCTSILGSSFPADPDTGQRPGFRKNSKYSEVTFDRFMEASDNYYAAALLLTGFLSDVGLGGMDAGCRVRTSELSLEPEGGAKYEGNAFPECATGSRPITALEQSTGQDAAMFRPDPMAPYWSSGTTPLFTRYLSAFYDIAPMPTSGGTDQAQTNLDRVSCVYRLAENRYSYGDGAYNTEIWKHLASAFRPEADPADDLAADRVACAMRQASPERESFRWESADDFRADLVTLVLGGGEGRWSTVGLAQAFTRSIMGKLVTATIIDATPSEVPVPPAGLSGVSATLRQATRLVIEGEHGTARSLKLEIDGLAAELKEVDPESQLVVFAKTGTPEIPLPVPTPESRTLNALVQQGKIGFVRGSDGQFRLALSSDTVLDPLDQDFSRLSQATLEAALASVPLQLDGEPRASARALRARLANLSENCRPKPVGSGSGDGASPELADSCPFETRAGQVLRYRTPLSSGGGSDATEAFGKVLVLTFGIYEGVVENGGELVQRAPNRAFTVAINIQASLPERSPLHLETLRRLIQPGSTLRKCITGCLARTATQARQPGSQSGQCVTSASRDLACGF